MSQTILDEIIQVLNQEKWNEDGIHILHEIRLIFTKHGYKRTLDGKITKKELENENEKTMR